MRKHSGRSSPSRRYLDNEVDVVELSISYEDNTVEDEDAVEDADEVVDLQVVDNLEEVDKEEDAGDS
jgi:hypothetical protein